jgi:EAL domain-containing protein (putative c-di-GMP-specific phosphodiesterase class I)
VDMLKIDRSFVSGLTSSGTGRTVAETIIALGRAFDMTTVAEGVETPEQFEMLSNLGCDQSQGYLHSRPMPAADVEPLLRTASASGTYKILQQNREATSIAHRG